MRVYPSLLCARPDCIRDEIMASAGADGYHIDIMDGHFVPYLACHPLLVRTLKHYVSVPLDVHLMVEDIEQVVDQVLHADSVTIHGECGDSERLRECLKSLRRQGQRAGIALNPETPASVLDPLWPDLDQILVMTVTPGQGGQTFQEDQLPKIHHIHQRIHMLQQPITLMVDGGITLDTGQKAAAAGADILVVGSYLFKHAPEEYQRVIRELQGIPAWS